MPAAGRDTPRPDDPTGRYLPSEAVWQSGGLGRFTPSDLVDLAAAGEPPTAAPGTTRAYTDTGFLRALSRGQLVSAGAWSEMTRWQPGPEGFYDDYGLGLGRYRFPAAQVIGHHGVCLGRLRVLVT